MLGYHEGSSLLHRLDPRTKLFLSVFISLLSLLSTNLYYLITVFLFSFFIFLLNRLPIRHLGYFSRMFVMLSIIITIFQGFFYPQAETIIYRILYFSMSLEGILFGAGISFRLFTILFAFSIFALTTRPKEMMESFGNFMPKDIAFSLTTAFRFIPIFQTEIKIISISQETRGLRKSGAKKITSYLPVMVPLFSKALMRAKNLAVSVESRGFGRSKIRYDLHMKTSDWAVILGTLSFGILVYIHLL